MSEPRRPTTVALTPFFESSDAETSLETGGRYVVGLRDANGQPCVQLTLDDSVVETALLARAEMTITLDHRGYVTVDPAGWSDEAVNLAYRAGHLPRVTLLHLVDDAVNFESLSMEEDPAETLAALRQLLMTALAHIDAATAALATAPVGHHGSLRTK
jgi:hypothetical protein